jgi:hypothetical protein
LQALTPGGTHALRRADFVHLFGHGERGGLEASRDFAKRYACTVTFLETSGSASFFKAPKLPAPP